MYLLHLNCGTKVNFSACLDWFTGELKNFNLNRSTIKHELNATIGSGNYRMGTQKAHIIYSTPNIVDIYVYSISGISVEFAFQEYFWITRNSTRTISSREVSHIQMHADGSDGRADSEWSKEAKRKRWWENEKCMHTENKIKTFMLDANKRTCPSIPIDSVGAHTHTHQSISIVFVKQTVVIVYKYIIIIHNISGMVYVVSLLLRCVSHSWRFCSFFFISKWHAYVSWINKNENDNNTHIGVVKWKQTRYSIRFEMYAVLYVFNTQL